MDTTEREYRLTGTGQYQFVSGGEVLIPGLDEVAIVFDKETGVRLKHGAPAAAERWVANTREKYREQGLDDLAENIVSMSGRFPLEELNRCIASEDYALCVYEKFLSGELKMLSVYQPQPAAQSHRTRNSMACG